MTARLAADPPFPGSTVGIERIGESARLVCACRVSSNGVPLGVAFTVLVVGRAAQVTLAPLSVSIEPTWQALGEK